MTEVRDNAARSRYELTLDGEVIGFADYELREGKLVVPYVEVRPEHGGQGRGSQLAAAVLADAQERGLEVVPLCSFMAWYVRNNA